MSDRLAFSLTNIVIIGRKIIFLQFVKEVLMSLGFRRPIKKTDLLHFGKTFLIMYSGDVGERKRKFFLE